MKSRMVWFLFAVACAGGVATLGAEAFGGSPGPQLAVPRVLDARIPFLENSGQVAAGVRFYARTFGGALFVAEDGSIGYSLTTRGRDHGPRGRFVFTEAPVEQLPAVPRGGRPSATTVNQFSGADPARWLHPVATFDSVDMGAIYEGIHMELAARAGNAEKIFRVAPGANPDRIRLAIHGVERLSTNALGELELTTSAGPVRFTKPVAFQEQNGNRDAVTVAYAIQGNTYGFAVGAYDRTRELVIDPLLASTLLGGSDDESARAIARDGDGNVYVAGATASADFPVTLGAHATGLAGNGDAYVAKFDSTLANLLAVTYLGGTDWDEANALALDGDSNVYVAGETDSYDFPVTDGAYDTTHGDWWGPDAFVAKLNGALTDLLAATFLGGGESDAAGALRVDGSGRVYVTGTTRSEGFPTTSNAYDRTFNGMGGWSNCTFSASLILLGGQGIALLHETDAGQYQVIFSEQRFDVGKWTNENEVWIPLGGADVPAFTLGEWHQVGFGVSNGQIDVSVDYTPALSVLDTNGAPLRGGRVGLATWGSPAADLYVSELEVSNPDGTLWYEGFWSGDDSGWSLNGDGCAVEEFDPNPELEGDEIWRLHLQGEGNHAIPRVCEGVEEDVFVSVLDGALAQILGSTYLGGIAPDEPSALALDGDGNVLVGGETFSPDFPVSAGAVFPTFNGNWVEYDVTLRLKFVDGTAEVSFRNQLNGEQFARDSVWRRYWIQFDASGVSAYKEHGSLYQYLGRSGDGLTEDEWHDVRIAVSNTGFAVHVDGALMLTIEDSGPRILGGVSLAANGWFEETASAHFDDLVVSRAGTPLWADDFEDNDIGDWDFWWSGWSLIEDAGGIVLQVQPHWDYAFAYPPWSYSGRSDAFVAKFDPELTTLGAATFLGHDEDDTIQAMETGAGGSVYVGGWTWSRGFPTTPGAYRTAFDGGHIGFVSRLDASLADLQASTLLGDGGEEINALSLGYAGRVYVGGSSWGGLPTTADAYDDSPNGDRDGFVAALDEGLGALLASTFAGGWERDEVNALCAAPDGRVYAAGETESWDFPVTNAAVPEAAGGGDEGFVLQLDADLTGPALPDIRVFPEGHNFGHVLLGTSATQTFTIVNSGRFPLDLGELRLQDGLDVASFTLVDDSCSGRSLPPLGAESGTVTVIFSPDSLFGKAVTLVVPSSDPDTPMLELPLYGSGRDTGVADTAFQGGLEHLRRFNTTPHDKADFLAADAAFRDALAADPNHYGACIFGAAARLLGLVYDPEVNAMLTAFGMPEAGRNPFEWLAQFPEILPADSPTTGAAMALLHAKLLPAIEVALAALARVPADWTGSIVFSPGELPIDNEVQVDAGDVQMFQAGLNALQALALIARAHDLDFDLRNLDHQDTPVATPVVDGDAGDWAGVAPLHKDAEGDNFGGPGSDIRRIYTAMDDTYAYVMVETYGNPIDPDGIVALIFNYKPGQNFFADSGPEDHDPEYDDLAVRFTADAVLDAWDSNTVAITGATVARGAVFEARIPLAELGHPDYFTATYANIWPDGPPPAPSGDPSDIPVRMTAHLDAYPRFGTITNPADFAAAATCLVHAVEYYVAGSEAIGQETDYQTDDLIIFAPEEQAEEQQTRAVLRQVRASLLSAPAQPFRFEIGQFLDLGHCFTDPVALRDLIRTGGWQQALVNHGQYQVDWALAHLAGVGEDYLEILLPADGLVGREQEADYGDVLLARSVLLGARACLDVLGAYQFDFDLLERLEAGTLTFNGLLADFPLLLTLPNGLPMAAASNSLVAAIDTFTAATEAARTEADPQIDDLFVVDGRQESGISRVRSTLADIRASLQAPIPVNTTLLPAFAPGARVHLGRFFAEPFVTRAHLPLLAREQVPAITVRDGVVTGTHRALLPGVIDEYVVAGTFPDPTFNGIFPGLTQEFLADALGIGSIAGTVWNSAGTLPLPDIDVCVVFSVNPSVEGDEVIACVTKTDAAGRYRLVLPYGEYRLMASGMGWLPEFWPEMPETMGISPVMQAAGTVVAGIVSNINFTLQAEDALVCEVLAGDTQGVTPFRSVFAVAVSGPGAEDLYFRWDFDGDGRPDLEGLGLSAVTNVFDEPGTYCAVVSVSNAVGDVATARAADCLKIGPDIAYVSLGGSHAYPFANWETAATNIAAAVAAGVDGTLVIVDDGRYELDGAIELRDGIRLTSAMGPADTILDGRGENRCVSLVHSNALIEGFTITGGSADRGGGVRCVPGAVVANCVIAGNEAYGFGMQDGGGGVLLDGGGELQASVVISNAANRGGGVLALAGGRIDECEVVRNRAWVDGGGVRLDGGGMVTNCAIGFNEAHGGGGGGGASFTAGGLMSDSTVFSNTASAGPGGGLYLEGAGVSVHHSRILDNTAPSAGGVLAAGALVRNCLIVGNVAVNGNGGGADLEDGSRLESCTVSGNSASFGGGARCRAGSAVLNSIVYFNDASVDADLNTDGFADIQYSCAPWLSGGGNLADDPEFRDLDGGDYRLSEFSPCINQGTNAAWMETATDLDRRGRIFSGIVDLGVYETRVSTNRVVMILAHSPKGNAAPPVNTMRFVFSDAMAPASFIPDEDVVSFAGPSGAILVTNAVWPSANVLDLAFADQSQAGVYELILGPNLENRRGRIVDQDADGSPGEPTEDRYRAVFCMPSFWIEGHEPSGDQVSPVGAVTVRFNKPVQHASFTTSDVRIAGPAGAIPFTNAPMRLSAQEYRLEFPTQPEVGAYHVRIGPGLVSEAGNPLDQDGDDVTGEPDGDVYDAGFTIIDVAGPRVVTHAPTRAAGTVADVFITFNEAMRPESFTPADAVIRGPGGDVVAVVAVTNLSANSFRVSFPGQTREGVYRFTLGPGIADLAGNLMNQDGDTRNGETFDDRYSAEFVIDGVGPWVVGTSVGGTTQHVAVTAVQLVFNEALDAASISTNAFALVGPCGTNLAQAVSNVTERIFEAQFPPCVGDGDFQVRVAPVATDIAGNAMDQDHDGAGGEPDDDRYLGGFVQRLPDLVATRVSGPGECEAGQTAEVTWSVANRGLGRAADGWRDRLYLSEDRALNAGDVPLGDLVFPETVAAGAGYNRSMSVTVPALSGVRRWLLVVVDVSNQVAETEGAAGTNNVVAALESIWFTARPYADLRVTAVTAPNRLARGEQAVLAWTVRNTGTAATSGAWLDRIFLSTDTNLNAQVDIRLQPDVRNPAILAVGEEYAQTLAFQVPADLPGGAYHVIVQTDAGNAVNEFGGEGNNTRASAAAAPAATPTPAFLDVVSVEVPAEVPAGGAATVRWTVRNSGESTRDPLRVDHAVWLSADEKLDFSGPEVDTALDWHVGQWYGRFEPGATYTVEATVKIPHGLTGEYFVIPFVDPPQWTGLEKNYKAARMTIVAPPPAERCDLVPASLVAPASGVAGQMVALNWLVRNDGPGQTWGASWGDGIYLSTDQTLDNADTRIGVRARQGDLVSGARYSVASFKLVLPDELEGEFYVLLQTDIYGQLYESNEDNNVVASSQRLAIERIDVDLTVASASAAGTAEAGAAMPVRWSVLNQGADAVSGSGWTDTLYLSPSNTLNTSSAHRLGVFAHAGNLAAAQAYTNEVVVALPERIEGTYHLFVVCDSERAVFERNAEDNNAFKVSPPIVITNLAPDLVVLAAEAPSNAVAGGILALQWWVTNAGQAVAAAPWTDMIYLSADGVLQTNSDIRLVAQVRTNALPVGDGYAGAAEAVQAPLPDRLDGNYTLFVVADAADGLYEKGSESNNVYRLPYAVTIIDQSPNLKVKSGTIPVEGVAGELVSIAWSTVNHGAEPVTNDWMDGVYLSADSRFDPAEDTLFGAYRHTAPLAVGATSAPPSQATWMRLPDRIEGDYYVFVRADDADRVYEHGGEQDNLYFAAIPMHISHRPADLQVVRVAGPLEAMAGSMIPVTWSVANRGGRPTSENYWQDGLYLSSDEIFEPASDVELGVVAHLGALPVDGVYTQTFTFALRQDLEGPYHLYAAADVRRQVYEHSAEGNNASAATSRVSVVGLRTDLKVVSLSVPAAATAGAAVPINWSVRNDGVDGTAVSAWSDAVYLSEDAELDSADRAIATNRHLGAVAAGASYAATTAVPLPQGLAGPFHLIVKTDASAFNDVFEYAAEDNNTASAGLSIALAPPADLQVSAIEVPTAVWSGQDLRIRWNVVNAGDADATAALGAWFDNVYLSRDPYLDIGQDRSLGSLEHAGALESRASYSREVVARLPYSLSGPYYVLVAADATDRVSERGREDNNLGVSPATVQVNLTPPSDLQVTRLECPTNAVIYGEITNFLAEVSNLGSQPAVGAWYDTLYLSADEQWDLDDPRLARLRHEGDLPVGSNYLWQVVTNVPAIIPGAYRLIARADVLDDVRETLETNNTCLSTGVVTIAGRELMLGAPQTNRLATGQARYFQVSVEADADLIVTLAGAAASGSELYLAHARIPTRSDFDFKDESDAGGQLALRVSGTSSGTYYVLVYGRECPAPSAEFVLLAALAEYAITGLDMVEAGNAGQATVTLQGHRFTPGMTARLENAAHQTVATGVVLHLGSGSIRATFDLDGVPPGAYTLVLTNPEGATRTVPFNVVPGHGGELFARLQIPPFVRLGRPYTFTLEYGNAGDADLPAPLFAVSTDPGARLRLRPEDAFGTAPLQVMGLAAGDPAGILPPGCTNRIEMEFQIEESGYVPFRLKTVTAESAAPMDWAAMEATYRIDGMPAAEWASAWSNLIQRLGPTWGTYTTVLGADATRLAQRGQRTTRVADLFAFELGLAEGKGGGAISGRVVDSHTSQPLAGVRLSAIATSIPMARYGNTGDDGRFVLDGLHPDTYTINVDGYVIDAGSLAVVDELTDSIAHDLRVSPGAQIMGYITTTGGAPVTNAYLSLQSSSSSMSRATATDVQGAYTLSGLLPESYTLTVDDGAHVEYVCSVPALSVGERRMLNVILSDGAILVGEVTDALNNLAIPDASVTATTDEGDTRVAMTDRNGAFRMEGFAPGSWQITASAAGFEAAIPIAVNVEGDQQEHVSILLNSGGAVFGRVLDARGGGMPNAIVVITTTSGTVARCSISDENGAYLCSGLPLQRYVVNAQASGYVDWSSSEVEVIAGSSVGPVDALLIPSETHEDGAAGVAARPMPQALDLSLWFKEGVLRDLALGWRSIPLWHVAGTKLNRFLMPAGRNATPTYPSVWHVPGSAVSETVKNMTECVRPYRDVKDDIHRMLNQEFLNSVSCDAVDVGGTYSGNVAPPNFYFGGAWDALNNGLAMAFGRIDAALFTLNVTDVRTLTTDNQTTVTISGLLKLEISDRYDFHPGNGILDDYGLSVQNAQWASVFTSYVVVLDNFEHTLSIRCVPPPTNPPPTNVSTNGTTGGGAMDPNDKLVDVGVGEGRFIAPEQVLGYTIRFENMSNAMASAQLITVTDPLHANLDWATFEVGEMKFGTNVVAVPPGLKQFHARVDLRPSGNDLLVDVDGGINATTGVARWTFAAIDPATGEFTEDFWDGFLPPNDANHIGEGYVKFRIRPKAGLPNGTTIPNVATIVFDWNEPIDTPLVSMTIDALAPVSRVSALPQESAPGFSVSWGGDDGTVGSGIASYDVYMSRDLGPFSLWLGGTAAFSAQFEGEADALYAFYSVARDHVGHVESAPAVPDTATLTSRRATAVDGDGDGMPDEWEQQHFGSALRATGITDRDGDGMPDVHEYLAGTDPTNRQSLLAMQALPRSPSDRVVVTWASASNRFYTLERSTNLLGEFLPLRTNVPATPAENVYTDSVEQLPRAFYRIRLQ